MVKPSQMRPPIPRAGQELLLLVQGGLGNQLFQLVLAESLAIALGRPLVSCTVLMESRSRRLRGLTCRSLSPLVRERLPVVQMPWHRYLPQRLAARLKQHFWTGVLNDRLLAEKAQQHSPLLERLGWVRFIHSHATHPALFGVEFTASWMATLEALCRSWPGPAVAVAVHVRRTDYLNPRSGFVPLGESYYRAALTHALAALPTQSQPIVVHVCSDDPQWCRNHLHDPAWRLEISAGTPEQDLATMVHARVLITSNSSLSAIAGHLAELRDSSTLVLTPGRWLLKDDGRLGDLRKANWKVVIP